MNDMAPAVPALAVQSPIRAWWTVAVLMVMQAVSLVDRNVLSIMIIEVRKDLGLNDFQVSLLQGLAFVGLYSFAGIFIGGLLDRYPARPILYVSVTVWSLAATAAGVVQSYAGMIATRLMTGVGEGSVNPVGQLLIASLFPKNRVSLPMSLFAGSGALGLGLAYFGGGLLLEKTTLHPVPGLEGFAPWRQVLILTALPGLLIAFLGFTVLEARPRRDRSTVSSMTWREVGGFLTVERSLLARLAAGYGLIGIVNFAMFSWAPTYARRVFHMTAGEVGLEMGLISTVGGIVFAAAYGYLVDREFSRGKSDFALRAYACGTMAAVPICVLGFSLDRHAAFLAALIAAQFAFVSSLGSNVAAIQLVTPPAMRGRMASLTIVVIIFCRDGRRPGAGRCAYRFLLRRSPESRPFDRVHRSCLRTDCGVVHLVGTSSLCGTCDWPRRRQ
jgi:MFS family permease